MLTDPRVSACIVLYHSGNQTLETIRSLQEATEKIDLFVVDNSPQDGTALAIQAQCPGITLLSQEKNIGFGQANNQVLGFLKSTYHLILNPDITFEPDLITRMVAFMDAHKDIAILTPRVMNTDGTEQFLPKYRPTIHYLMGGFLQNRGRLLKKWGIFDRWRREFTMQDEEITQPIEVGFATGCFMLIRTQFFRKLQGFDPKFFLYQEDSDLTLRAQQLGKVVYHPDMVVTHAWNRESHRSMKAIRMHLRSTIRLFNKWGWKW